MRKFGFIFLIILFVFVSCNLEKSEESKQIYAIKNYSDYDSVGVATVEVGSKSSRALSKNVLIGIKNTLIEQLEFLDEEGNPLQVNLNTCISETENFMFLSFMINNLEQVYCLHKPSGNIFPVDFHIDRGLPNDMIEDRGDVVYCHTDKISYKNEQLTVESYVAEEASRLFTFFLVDKYGNIYSTSDAEYKGKMITTSGKLLTIPSNYRYRIGENGKVYYWEVGEKDMAVSSGKRGYFDAEGKMVDISEGDFFPSFLGEDQESTNNRWVRDFSYTDGDDSYRIYLQDNGGNTFYQYIVHVHFDNDADESYTEDKLNLKAESTLDLNTILSGCRFKQIVDKYLYLLNDSMLFRIDMTTGNIEVVNNTYSYYLTCEYLGNKNFRLTVVDVNQNKVSVGVDENGKAIELSKEKGSFSSITISPIVRL